MNIHTKNMMKFRPHPLPIPTVTDFFTAPLPINKCENVLKSYFVSSSQLFTRAFIVTLSWWIVSRVTFDSELFFRIKSRKKYGMMASRTVSICRALFVPESYATTKTHSEMHSSIDMVSGSPGFEKKSYNFVERLQCKDGARAIWQNLVEVFQLFYSI